MTSKFISTIGPAASGTIFCNPDTVTDNPGFYPLLAGNGITINPVAASGISINSSGGGNISGIVNSSASGLVAFYSVAGSAISGNTHASINAGNLTLRSPGEIVLLGASSIVFPNIPVGLDPLYTVVTPDGSKLYVSNHLSTTVSVINTNTNTLITNINIGVNPGYLAITPDGSKVYVCNTGSFSMSVISTTSDTVTTTIPGFPTNPDFNPAFMTILPSGTKGYVSSTSYGYVNVIDIATDTVTTAINISGIGEPAGSAVIPSGAKLYVIAGSHIVVINTSTDSVTTSISTGLFPNYIASTPDGTKVYMPSQTDIQVVSTSTDTILTNIAGNGYQNIVFTSDSTKAFVCDLNNNSIDTIDTSSNTITNVIYVNLHVVHALAITPDDNFVYAANAIPAGPNIIYVIKASTNTIIKTFILSTDSDIVSIITNSHNNAYLGDFLASSVIIPISITTSLFTNTISAIGGPANFVLPPNNGSLNQHLATDGAGNTSWNTHSSAQSQLSGNVAMTSANTAYDGPSVTLAAGTWFVSASILIQSTSTSAPVTAKLWNGTTVYASSVIDMPASNASSVTVRSIVTLGSLSTIKISAASSTGGYSIIKAAILNAAGNTASTITAVQL